MHACHSSRHSQSDGRCGPAAGSPASFVLRAKPHANRVSFGVLRGKESVRVASFGPLKGSITGNALGVKNHWRASAISNCLEPETRPKLKLLSYVHIFNGGLPFKTRHSQPDTPFEKSMPSFLTTSESNQTFLPLNCIFHFGRLWGPRHQHSSREGENVPRQEHAKHRPCRAGGEDRSKDLGEQPSILHAASMNSFGSPSPT